MDSEGDMKYLENNYIMFFISLISSIVCKKYQKAQSSMIVMSVREYEKIKVLSGLIW